MTPRVEISYELERCMAALQKYGELSEKSESEIIAKQSAKLRRNIWQGLRALMPAKGEVRAERMAGLASGIGVKVRASVYAEIASKFGGAAQFGQRFTSIERKGKTLNFQALAVQRELGLRESGRGFMAFSTPKSAAGAELAHIEKDSRYNQLLSTFDIDVRPKTKMKFAEFTWQADSPALEGLSAEQQTSVLLNAVRETTDDIMVYVNRKVEEDKAAAGL
jgi:hypothetical protein